MIAEPGVYETNVELGLWSPIPWYYSYFQAAERCHCPPWELIEEYTSREFWFAAAQIINLAESDHAQYLQQRRDSAAQQSNTSQPLARR